MRGEVGEARGEPGGELEIRLREPPPEKEFGVKDFTKSMIKKEMDRSLN